jgi:hypothetical protein
MAKAKYDPKKDPRVKYHDDGSATIELDYKVVRGKGDALMELTVKRPTMGDMEASDRAEGSVGKSILIIAAVTGEPSAVIRRLDASDFERLSAVVEGYGGGNVQETGEESSPTSPTSSVGP